MVDVPRVKQFLQVFLLVAIFDVLVIIFVSAIGLGPKLYSAVANDSARMYGNLAACLCAFWLLVLFVFDAAESPRLLQYLLALVTVGLVLASTVLRGISYPWAATIVAIAIPPFLVGLRRLKQKLEQRSNYVEAEAYYKVSGFAFFACGIVALFAWVLWQVMDDKYWNTDTRLWLAEENLDVYQYVHKPFALNYTEHCNLDTRNLILLNGTQAETNTLTAACRTAETVWFVQWGAPSALFICNFLCSLFCYAFSRISRSRYENIDEGADRALKRRAELRFILKIFVLTLSATAAGIYCSLYVAGAAVRLASASLSIGLVAAALVLGWVFIEVDRRELMAIFKDVPLSGPILGIMQSDWVRAMAVGGLNVLIPILAVLDMMRQVVRRFLGTSESRACLTDTGMRIKQELDPWNWYSIFMKVNLLAMLFTSGVVGSKLTFIFFSWLNATLGAAGLTFTTIAFLVWIIGLTMFLCPIVPGTAVYLFVGVVLGAQAQLPGSVGFWAGLVIGMAACTVAKFIACVLQYSIGYFAGMQVKVQQMVGVDKVATRAMEQILKQNGMKLDKCSILTAGPDFPTSVLCGILKLNIPQMLLGTIPVIFVSIIPQTIVGGLLTKGGEDASFWALVSSVVTGLAALVQAVAMLYFTYAILTTVERHGEALAAQDRPEHTAVAELTKNEQDLTAAFLRVTKWDAISSTNAAVILASMVAFIVSGFLLAADFVLTEKICFLKFKITNSIADSFELGGLEGNALNVVVLPLGAVALVLACVGFLLHIIIGFVMDGKAANALKEGVESRGRDPPPALWAAGRDADQLAQCPASP